MDFNNKRYFLIGKYCSYANIPKQLKRYFKCKIRCHIYRHDNEVFTHCVSIDENKAKYLVNFLNDKRVPFIEIYQQLERVNDYTFRSLSDEERQKKKQQNKDMDSMNKMFKELEDMAKFTKQNSESSCCTSLSNFIQSINDATNKMKKIVMINPDNKCTDELIKLKDRYCFDIIYSKHIEKNILYITTKDKLYSYRMDLYDK